MASRSFFVHRPHKVKKRPGIHSKNASVGRTGYKKKYRGQGR